MSGNSEQYQAGREGRARRERLLLVYQDALRRGDLEDQEAVLRAAENDAEFEEALWDLHVALGARAESEDARAAAIAQNADAARVRDLAAAHLSAPVTQTRAEAEAVSRQQANADAAADDAELPPLVLRDVTARLRQEISRGVVAARDRAIALHAAAQIESAGGAQTIEDDYLTRRGARTLLARLGLAGVGTWFEQLFHGTILDLTMAREQNDFRLAAARRARQQRGVKQPGADEEKETRA